MKDLYHTALEKHASDKVTHDILTKNEESIRSLVALFQEYITDIDTVWFRIKVKIGKIDPVSDIKKIAEKYFKNIIAQNVHMISVATLDHKLVSEHDIYEIKDLLQKCYDKTGNFAIETLFFNVIIPYIIWQVKDKKKLVKKQLLVTKVCSYSEDQNEKISLNKLKRCIYGHETVPGVNFSKKTIVEIYKHVLSCEDPWYVHKRSVAKEEICQYIRENHPSYITNQLFWISVDKTLKRRAEIWRNTNYVTRTIMEHYVYKDLTVDQAKNVIFEDFGKIKN